MFCEKCGKEMQDGATFCVNCGAKLGAANVQSESNNEGSVQEKANEQTNLSNESAQGAQQNTNNTQQNTQQQTSQAQQPKSGEIPPIIANLKKYGLGFFTKKGPVSTVAESMDDNSWSGIILAGAGILLSSLIYLINFNSSTRGMLGNVGGKLFLLSFITMVVVFFATAGGMFVLINSFLKKKISFSGAVNLVAYSSILLICVTILNLIINLIWLPLAALLSTVSLLGTIILIFSAIEEKYKLGKDLFVPFMLVMTVVIAISLLFTYFSAKSLLSDLMGSFRGLF